MKTTSITLATAILALASCKPGESETMATAPQVSAAESAGSIPYLPGTCLVSGEELGSMGTPPAIVYHGQQVKFCCNHCIPDFEKEPEKFIAMLKRGGNAGNAAKEQEAK